MNKNLHHSGISNTCVLNRNTVLTFKLYFLYTAHFKTHKTIV